MFMIKTAILYCLSFSLFATPFEQSYKVASFKEGYDSQDRIIFIGKSTKVGLMTSTFEGVVKDFKVKGDLTDKRLSSILVSFPVEAMDTDIDGRNEKMYDLCLDRKNSPEITVSITEVDLSKGNEQEVPAKIKIRGKEFPLTLKTKIEETGSSIKIVGNATSGFKELEIPDPSILIAKVKNPIEMEFKIELKKP